MESTALNLPAVFNQRGASPRMSDRYVNICTADVIETMKESGFLVESYKADKCYKTDPAFGRHVVTFRNPELIGHDGDYVPQILFMNSHNGKTPADFRFGLYRFVCANGLVIGNDMLRVRVKHMGTIAEQVHQQIALFHEKQSGIVSVLNQWQQIELDRPKQLEFVNAAMNLRFGDKAGQYNPEKFLQVQRAEDDNASLWGVFNRVQEHMVKGGIQGARADGRRVSAKKLDSIGLNIDFNSKLWTLAGEVAKEHAPIVIDVQAREIATV